MAKVREIAGTAADPLVEFVDLFIDGKTYRLAYDFFAIAKAEQAVNALRAPGEEKCNLLHGIAAIMAKGVDARQQLGLFYGALLPGQPKMTLEQTARLIRIDTLPGIYDAMGAAYSASMPSEGDLAKGPTEGAAEGGAAPDS